MLVTMGLTGNTDTQIAFYILIGLRPELIGVLKAIILGRSAVSGKFLEY